jgi:hypothetical protein
MRKISNKNCRENKDTRFMSYKFFPKIVPFFEIMTLNVVEAQATNDSMAAPCMLDY